MGQIIRIEDADLIIPDKGLGGMRSMWAEVLRMSVEDLDRYLPAWLAGKPVGGVTSTARADGEGALRFLFGKRCRVGLQVACDAVDLEPDLVREALARKYGYTVTEICREADA
ncbi:hypothetical protein [Chitinimonas koreensis]|uniref:hypothetical protein n=1 Tax=Chitinimonas koreensis TaxID=356302 RepID=UPI000424FA08|nr:hypothetical protein [Chitinimonas koreensis]QNM94916.1 hypothetical protein H9L41_13400 [Chitinimonas koreensis]